MAVFMSSCDARRLDDWDRVSWPEFIGADRFSEDYRKVLGNLPQFIQASKADETCARYIALVFEAFVIYPLMGRGTNGAVIRMFDRPTNEAWIDPWMSTLRDMGVRTRLRHVLTGLETEAGRIVGAHGKLAGMQKLGVAWMNGIDFYLSERTGIIKGLVDCVDSPWACTFVPQAQFWSVDFAATYGDGRAHDKIAAAIADWTKPGVIYGKPATDCTPAEIAHEVWEQIKRHVNRPDAEILTDRMLLSWEIDRGMRLRRGHLVSKDPLVLPTIGTGKHKPGVATGLPNLFLAGDYLDSLWEVANMEAAGHNGRRAANAVLERAGSRETPAKAVGPYRPPEWEDLKRIDEDRHRRGEPNLFDTDMPAERLDALLAGRPA